MGGESPNAIADCPFCRFAEIPVGHELYRDDGFLIVLDRESLGFGHSLLIPRRHVAKVYDLEVHEIAEMFSLASCFARSLEAKLGVKAVGMIAFGSGLPHAHLHLVPHNESVVLMRPQEYAKRLSNEELIAEAGRLRTLIGDFEYR